MHTATRWLIFGLFLLSGVAALLYQIAWQRLLVLFAGGDVISATIIITAFMAGLGSGSLAGGALADRLSPRGNLALFAAAELGIGLFGLASGWLFQDVLYAHLAQWGESRAALAIILFFCLLPPTFLMGLSLPVLARALTAVLEEAAGGIGRLYAVNTLGAAAGAALGTWLLMPLVGIRGSLACAAVLNGACAAALLPALCSKGAWLATTPVLTKSALSGWSQLHSARPGIWIYLAVFFLTGLTSLAAEMTWLRLLGAMAKSSAHTMGTLLSCFLAGLGGGALVAASYAARCPRPWIWFLRLQAGAMLWAASSVVLLLRVIGHLPPGSGLRMYLESYEPISANTAVHLCQHWMAGTISTGEIPLAGVYPLIHFGLPLLVIFPSTFLMGSAFPLLQRVVHSDARQIGMRTGVLQAANILGCMAGAVGTCFLLFPFAGSSGSLRLLALAGTGLAAVSLPRSIRIQVPVLVGGLVLLWSLPAQPHLWAMVHGTTPDRIVLAEGPSGVSLLKRDPDKGRLWLYVNGIGQSWIPYGGVHSLLGAIPVLLHPTPERIALIGLGSGDTLYAMLARPETREVVCAEIVEPQLRTLQEIAAEPGMDPVRRLLEDPRVRMVSGDGRMMVLRDESLFDIIEADALRPDSAHSGTLYSEEYFRLLSKRLRPGGMAVTWLPTERVAEAMIRVFPNVAIFGGMIGVGSMDPLPLQQEVFSRRLQNEAIQAHFRAAGVDLLTLLNPVLGAQTQIQIIGPEYERNNLMGKPNTDAFPRDEFALPALWGK